MVFKFDYQKMNMFKSVRCWKEWCPSLFDNSFSKSCKSPIRFDVRCPFLWSQALGVHVRSSIYKHIRKMMFKFVQCSIKRCSTRGDAAIWKVRGLRGGTFFGATFYCVFGRFGKMTYLVNLKKWGAQAPSAPPLYAAPGNNLWTTL